MNRQALLQRQGLPLEAKIILSIRSIEEFYNHFQGDVYVSFSGGKDSTVMLHLIRSIYPNIKGVFSDTGLEYPEIRDFVKTKKNILWIKPKRNFKEILDKYGYPIISKEVSQKIYEIRHTKSAKLLHKRLYGDNTKYKSGKLPEKWKYLINEDFKISDRCCYFMKKSPLKKYKCYIGNMAHESHFRKQRYIRTGCNSFTGKISSQPLSFWTEKDIWEYIKINNIQYSKIYDMGYDRTGCMFCMFGVHLEKEPNRFQKMKETHPTQYNYCINKLGCGKVLDYINVDY